MPGARVGKGRSGAISSKYRYRLYNPAIESARTKSLLYAAYLGTSWTWVIGMFLPVLLVRDYGYLGFIVFALPNVYGAAAMGYILKSREHSQQLVRTAEGACFSFSLVTIAFHIFVGLWLLPGLVGFFFPSLILAIIIFLFRRDLIFSAIVWIISLALFALLLFQGKWILPEPSGVLPVTGVVPLFLVCVFGFFYCPYLDLTFHHAFQESPYPRRSFAFGFVGVFGSMILFTLFYSHTLFTTARVIVGIHMTIQIALTIVLHYRQIEPILARGKYLAAIPPAVLLPALAGVVAAHSPPIYGEYFYRTFMVFYGLIFPAYVLLRASRYSKQTWIILCALASPFYFIAFILGHMYWLIPGLALVVLPAYLGCRTAAD